MGVIYILTNPSFPEYVKIGYADDVNQRLAQLNRSECIPFAFRIYATYEVKSFRTIIPITAWDSRPRRTLQLSPLNVHRTTVPTRKKK